MQFMTRRENEGVVIGDRYQVTVLEICEDHVLLGVCSGADGRDFREETVYFDQSRTAVAQAACSH